MSTRGGANVLFFGNVRLPPPGFPPRMRLYLTRLPFCAIVKPTGRRKRGRAVPILSVEVGGENAVPGESWAEGVLSDGDTPTDFIVDYVRAYQYT